MGFKKSWKPPADFYSTRKRYDTATARSRYDRVGELNFYTIL